MKEKYLHTIANLTLSGNNGALSNKGFQAKKEMNVEGKEQGYNFSRLWLNSYLREIDHWDMNTLNERFEKIYERFLKVWTFPDVEIEEVSEEDELNIFDAEPPTHKKLEYFIFENTKVETDAVAKMYLYVITELFRKNTQLLTTQDLVKINRNIDDFRSPQEIANGWYIETNLDSNSKFVYLKKLLSLFEMEEELIIKYTDSETEISHKANRHIVRHQYWQHILQKLENTNLFKNVNPSKDHWLSTGAGTAGVSYSMVITRSFARIELTISSSSKEQNKKYFKKLLNNKTEIEEIFGKELDWEELPDNKMSRIKIEQSDVNLFNERTWEQMDNFFRETLPKFEESFKSFIQNLR